MMFCLKRLFMFQQNKVRNIKEYGVLETKKPTKIRGKLTVPLGETLVVKLFHQQPNTNCFNGALNILILEKNNTRAHKTQRVESRLFIWKVDIY